MKNLLKFAAYLFAVLVLWVANRGASGGSVSWQGLGGGSNDSGSWEASPSGWSNGATPGPFDTAQLLNVSSGTRTITVDAGEGIGDMIMQQNSVGPYNVLTLNNSLTINALDPTPIVTTTGVGANAPVINVGGNILTVGTSYVGQATMTFGNVNIGNEGQVVVQNTAPNDGGGYPGTSFSSTFGAVSMASGASIQFSSIDLAPTDTQTFSGPMSVTGQAEITESATRFSGASTAFNGGVSVTGGLSGLTVFPVGPVTFGMPTTPGLSVAAGDTVQVTNQYGPASATVNGLSLAAGAGTLLQFTGQDAGNSTAPITVGGTVSLGAGSTVLLQYTTPQGNAVFNIAGSATVVQDGATLDFDYFGASLNNGTRQFINNGNWTLQNQAVVTITQNGSSASVSGGFGNLSGNVNSGTMSVNSGSQVAFADMTNNGTLNLGTSAALGAVFPDGHRR